MRTLLPVVFELFITLKYFHFRFSLAWLLPMVTSTTPGELTSTQNTNVAKTFKETMSIFVHFIGDTRWKVCEALWRYLVISTNINHRICTQFTEFEQGPILVKQCTLLIYATNLSREYGRCNVHVYIYRTEFFAKFIPNHDTIGNDVPHFSLPGEKLSIKRKFI